MPPRSTGAQSVGIAAARAADRDFFLAVRNEAGARRASFHTSPIDFKTHQNWFVRLLRDPSEKAFRILAGKSKRPAGTLRVSRTARAEAEVHISLLPEWRGRGVAGAAVRRLLAELERGTFGWKPRRVLARIKPQNSASIAFFRSLGFTEQPGARKKGERRFFRGAAGRRRVVFVIDGGPDIGMGHLTRASALARELAGRFDCRFFCRQGIGRIRRLSRFIPKSVRFLGDAAGLRKADAVVVDTLTLPSEPWARRYLPRGLPVLLVGSYLEVPHWARVCVNPYTRPARIASGAQWLSDPSYTVLAPDFAAARRRGFRRALRPQAARVLVFAGGGDTRGMLFKILDALETAADKKITVVAGGYFTGMKKLLRRQKEFGGALRIRTGLSAGQMLGLMKASDAAVLSLGRSCDETRSVGLPALVLSSSELNRLGALKMQSDGGIRYAGDVRSLSAAALRRKLAAFLADAKTRSRLSRAGMKAVDGRGGERVARLIALYAEGKA